MEHSESGEAGTLATTAPRKRKPKIVPAKILLPDARPLPDYFLVRRKVELAMRAAFGDLTAIEPLSEKYVDLLISQIGVATLMTTQQMQAHFDEISKAAVALAKKIKRAGPDAEAQLDACRATLFDRPGLKRRPRSVEDGKVWLQWLAEAATSTEPAAGKTKAKGPPPKNFAQTISRLAVEDYYRLTRLKPSATQLKEKGFLSFLEKMFEALEIDASAERCARDAVEWFKTAYGACSVTIVTGPGRGKTIKGFKRRGAILEE